MKVRYAFLSVALVSMLFASSVAAPGSDADGEEVQYFDTYYEQLTDGQRAIYDAMEALHDLPAEGKNPEPYTKYPASNYGGIYNVTVRHYYVAESRAVLLDMLKKDADRAWQATKMDDPLAFWTWGADSGPHIDVTATGSSGSTSEFTVGIKVHYAYYNGDDTDMSQKIDAVKQAIDGFEIKGGTDAEKVRSINAWLCGDDVLYDPAVRNPGGNKQQCPYNVSAYGAFVHKENGKHIMVCDAYAAAFKALCDKANIQCKTVVGTSVQTSSIALHAWNLVIINGIVYAVDTTWNDTSGEELRYLAVGSQSMYKGQTFLQTHQAFLIYKYNTTSSANDYYYANWFNFQLPEVEKMSASGYTWKTDDDLGEMLREYAPWTIVALICIVLAYVLWNMGRKGE